MSNSQEEEIARDYICFGNPDATVIVLDATCIEKNLNLVFQTLEITDKVIVCVNLLDEAKKKGIYINLNALSDLLGVPVVGTTARKSKTLKKLLDTIVKVCNLEISPKPKLVKYSPIIEDCLLMLSSEVQKILPSSLNYLTRWISIKLIGNDVSIIESIEDHLSINFNDNISLSNKLIEVNELLLENEINNTNFKDKIVSSIVFKAEDICNDVISYRDEKYNLRDRKIDTILTSKKFGIPIMILFLGIIFWLTIIGANYPSTLLSNLFDYIEDKLVYFLEIIHTPSWILNILVYGMYQTVSWVIAVMLPPMAIFFPLFTILEDLGYLPRIAFNLDNYFKKACTTGKQALTMCMGVTKWEIFKINLS
jgi:ferrous iron transport protein B